MGHLEGVRSVQPDLQTGWVRLEVDPWVEFALERFPKQVQNIGFHFESMQIQARGQVQATPDGKVFRIEGWKQTFPLSGNHPPVEKSTTIEARVFPGKQTSFHID
ncbi:MAG: hypothetical protein QF752_17445 [Planctomycetota bacterium]|nr:hypothetical protein [Planctomycetota bacterium]